MVGGEDDHRVVQLARRRQLIHQALHGQLQLQLAGQVALHRLAVWQVGHLVVVPVRLGVLLPGIVEVAAHGENIDHELVLVHKLGNDLLHHLPVGGGLDLFQLQAVPDAVILIAHVGVGEIAVVVGVEIVVVGQRPVPQLLELIAEAEGHIVVRRLGVAPHAGLGDQAGGGHILPVGGGHPPQRGIEVVADDSLMGQLPQGGGPLRVQHLAGKGLCHDPDEVFSLETAGPLIFRRGLYLGEVVVHVHQLRHVRVPLL